MKQLVATITLSLSSAAIFAQQDPASAQFWNTLLHVNPATAGLEYRHAAFAQFRTEWSDDFNSPKAVFANYSVKINKLHGAAGVSYEYSAMGFDRRQIALVHYAFHIPVKSSILSVGVSGGALDLRLDPHWVSPTATDDPLLPKNSSVTAFDLNAGIAFHASKWNAGFAVTHLNAPTVEQPFYETEVPYTIAPHYRIFADYRFSISEKGAVHPRLMAGTDGIRSYIQGALVGEYKNAWLGFSVRTDEAAGILAGYDIKGRFRIAYSFEWPINRRVSFPLEMHEFTLGFLLK